MKKRKARNSRERAWIDYIKDAKANGIEWSEIKTKSDFNSQRQELRARKLVYTPEEILARQVHESEMGRNVSTKQVNAARRAMSNLSLEGIEEFENFNPHQITEADWDNLDQYVSDLYHELKAQGYSSTAAAHYIAVHVYGSPD